MNKTQQVVLPMAGSFLLTAVVAAGAAEPPALERIYLDSTNRITASVRFGLNISCKFKGVGSSFTSGSPFAAGRTTPKGDAYNYDDGYVLTDISGNAGNMSWYWGYDQAGQVNASAANSIDFHHTTGPSPSENGNDDSPYIGAEVTYDYLLGVKEDWHHLRYGIELAANFMPFDITSGGSYNASVTTRTDTYGYTPGTTPPSAPYYGSFQGPGFLLNVPRISSTTATVSGGKLTTHQVFDANLWGFRLGPYLERPLTEKLSLHLSGGLAVGIVDTSASWNETLTLPGGSGSVSAAGGGSDLDVVWGYYIGLDVTYKFSEHWGLDIGVQFQDVGVYSHNFGGRTAELDMSNSIYLQGGVSYSF